MQTYNIYISSSLNTFNVLGLPAEKLNIIVNAYKKGYTTFTISGRKYFMNKLHEIKFFTHDAIISAQEYKQQLIDAGEISNSFGGGYYIPPKYLAKLGKDVTDSLIGDLAHGDEAKKGEEKINADKYFVHPERIEALKKISQPAFDLARLIRFCEEINDNFSRENYLSVAMLGRSVINHIPPILGLGTFNEVANNYGGASFKKVMGHLNTTRRSTADSFLHETIRKKESLPNDTLVNFSQDLDFLLSEIVRKLNEK